MAEQSLDKREVEGSTPSLTTKCNCGREYVYDRAKGHKRHICNSCNANRRRNEIKRRMVEYKGGKCVACGYDRCIRALGFHHLSPASKNFDLCRAYTKPWETVKTELDKCDLLCANCHMEEEDLLTRQAGEWRK